MKSFDKKKLSMSTWLDLIFGNRSLESRNVLQPKKLRGFEQLEDRIALSVNPVVSEIPDTLSLYAGSAIHYALEDGYTVDLSALTRTEGINAELLTGPTVTISYGGVKADGSVADLGDITIQLFEDDAPESVSQFLDLIEDDYYDNLKLHRIIKDFMMQCDTSTVSTDSPSSVPDEFSDYLLHNSAGIVAYTKAGNNTYGGNSFYITQKATNWLNGTYNVFGFVLDGYDVLDNICNNYYTQDSSGNAVTHDEYSSIRMTDVTLNNTSNPEGTATRILRISVDADTIAGTGSITIPVTDASGNVTSKTVAVTVQNDLGKILTDETGSTFTMTAGESKTIDLPSTLDGKTVYSYSVIPYYSIADLSENPDGKYPTGVTVNYADNTISIDTEDYVSQIFRVKVTLTMSDNYADTVYYDINVKPISPDLTLDDSSLSSTYDENRETVTTTDSLVYEIDGVYEYTSLHFKVVTETGESWSQKIKAGTDYVTDSDTYNGILSVRHQEEDSLDKVTVTVNKADLLEALGLTENADDVKITVSSWLIRQDDDDALAEGTEAKEAAKTYSDSVTITLINEDMSIDIDGETGLQSNYDADELATGEALAIALTTNQDESGNTVTFAFKYPAALPSGMTLGDNNKTLSWTPSENDANRVYSVILVATDNIGRRDEKTIVFNLSTSGIGFDLADSEGEPVEGVLLQEGTHDTLSLVLSIHDTDTEYTYTGACTITNVDDSTLTYSADVEIGENNRGTIDKPMIGMEPGTYQMAITLTGTDADGATASVTKLVTFTLTSTNTAPIITYVQDRTYQVTVGKTFTIGMTAEDNDYPVQQLEWSFAEGYTAPEGMTISTDGAIFFVPTAAQAGRNYQVKVAVSDLIETTTTDEDGNEVTTPVKGLTSTPLTLRFSVDLKASRATGNPDDDVDNPVNPDDPGGTQVEAPADLGNITNAEELASAWEQAVSYEQTELANSTDRYVTALQTAAQTLSDTIVVLVNELSAGQLSRSEYRESVLEANRIRHATQQEAYETWQQDRSTIASYFSTLADHIIAAATTLELTCPADKDETLAAINAEEPWNTTDLAKQRLMYSCQSDLEVNLALHTVGVIQK